MPAKGTTVQLRLHVVDNMNAGVYSTSTHAAFLEKLRHRPYIISYGEKMPFRVRLEPEVESFVANLATVPRRQVERDLEKLASRGTNALPPLTGNLQGPIWELRSRVEGHGLYRLFYYRDGETSFHVFYAYQKKDEKLPRYIRTEVLKRYQDLTGRKP